MSGALPVVHAERAHAELGASAAHRWMNCPGSIRLSREVPASEDTIHSQTGTAAHELAELALRRGVDPETFVGTTLNGIEVDEEMADHVRVYVEHCRNLAELAATSGGDVWIEHKFNLAPLSPPGPMFGTADFVAYDGKSKTLHVADLKFGQGVVVEAKGNKQLRYYALGAALSLSTRYEIRDVEMYIVQPRAAHSEGMVRSDECSFAELIDFAGELMEAAKATAQPDAPLVAGRHCKFCPASAVCPAQRDQAQALAQVEFSAMPAYLPPAPETLGDDEIAEMISKFGILEEWMKAMRMHAQRKLEQGETFPGYKLVAKRATRKIGDEETAVQLLRAKGNKDEEIYVQKLKSPAQLEKLLGKKPFNELLGDLVVKESSGYNMVPAHDPRPAIEVTPGAEFAALPRGDEQAGSEQSE